MSFTILGTGSCLSSHVLTNDDLSKFLDTSDEWIRTRTGIEERHILAEGETLTQMVSSAAQNALDNAGITADELDYIVCATLAGDNHTPSLACGVQQTIGANCPAADLNAACAGFIYALDFADGLFARKKAKYVLIAAGENLSSIMDWTDRSTSVLFGDGSGAVVLGPGDDLLALNLQSNAAVEKLNIPFPRPKTPAAPEGPPRKMTMDGHEVYRFAIGAITTGIQAALDEVGLTLDDVTYFHLHQANLRIIEAAMKKLGVPMEKCPTTIQYTGNTSAASIPILMDKMNREGRYNKGDLIAMSGFGAGLVSGSALIRWSK